MLCLQGAYGWVFYDFKGNGVEREMMHGDDNGVFYGFSFGLVIFLGFSLLSDWMHRPNEGKWRRNNLGNRFERKEVIGRQSIKSLVKSDREIFILNTYLAIYFRAGSQDRKQLYGKCWGGGT